MVMLPEEADLSDGVIVEVRPIADARPPDDERQGEALFRQRLRDSGLLTEPRPTVEQTPVEPYEPVTVRGKPLSEVVLEERR